MTAVKKKSKLCGGCGQPMLPKGSRRKHPTDYRHASGCPLSGPRRSARAAFAKLASTPDFGGRNDRPYIGQPHTFTGLRGSVLLLAVHTDADITLRDIGDAFKRAMVRSAEASRAGVFGGNVDYDAVVQTALCEIERMIGETP